MVSERISDAAYEPSMRLPNRSEFNSAEAQCASVNGFGIFHSQQQPDGAAAE